MYSCVGADIVGINCHLDPLTCVRTVKLMKEGLEKAGLKAHLMIQPLGFHTPECNIGGYTSLPEYPFGQHLYIYFLQNNLYLMALLLFQHINVVYCMCLFLH